MKQKYYLLNEICDILQISPDMIYRWGTICPELQTQVQNEKGRFTAWDLDLLKYSKRAIAVYEMDYTSIRKAIVQWINTTPKPLESPDYEHLTQVQAEPEYAQVQTEQVHAEQVHAEQAHAEQVHAEQVQINQIESNQDQLEDEIDSLLNQHLPKEVPTRQLNDSSMTIPIKEIKEKMNIHPNQNNQPRDEDTTDVAAWKKAFNSSQLELTQLRADLSKARETIHLQQTNLKQVANEFNALKELIRKEIYNLRDLVVDK
jgi:hypothetical protein